MILIFSQIVITIATPIIIKIIKGDCDFLILKNPLQPKKVERMSKKLNKLSHNEYFLIDILFNQERKTRMVFIEKIKTKDPMKLNSKVYQLIKRNNLYVKSITIDNGI